MGRFAQFGLAGELATEYGITGWPEGAAVAAAAEGLQLWRSLRGQGDDERRQVLESVARFIARHGDSRFSRKDATNEAPVRDRAGYWSDEPDGRRYLFNADAMREALKGSDFRRGLDILQEVGAISRPSASGERAKFHRIQGRGGRFYEVAADALEEAGL